MKWCVDKGRVGVERAVETVERERERGNLLGPLKIGRVDTSERQGRSNLVYPEIICETRLMVGAQSG